MQIISKRISLFVFLFLFFLSYYSFSQLDTVKFIKSIIVKHTTFENLSIEFIKNGGIQYPDDWMKKKVWMVKDRKTAGIQKMRVETTFLNSGQVTTNIINEKQKFFINTTSKRSDIFSFNLLKDDKLKEFYQKQEIENLPSFMISEGNIDAITKEMYEYIKNSGNVSLSILSDTVINGIPCFGIKITDMDKNNGYLADKTENDEEKYADKTIEYTYFRKSDSLIAYRKTDFIYTNPIQIRSQVEQLSMYLLNNKQNENTLLYTIKTDTLKDYFQTVTRFNGAENETELADFSIKKAPQISEKTIKGDFWDMKAIRAKMILLAFWTLDCEDCMLQLQALNEQYNGLKVIGLEVVAINASDKLTNAIQQHVLKIDFQFPVIFSESLGHKYLTTESPAYFLLDKDLKIKEIFYQLSQKKVDKIQKKLK